MRMKSQNLSSRAAALILAGKELGEVFVKMLNARGLRRRLGVV